MVRVLPIVPVQPWPQADRWLEMTKLDRWIATEPQALAFAATRFARYGRPRETAPAKACGSEA